MRSFFIIVYSATSDGKLLTIRCVPSEDVEHLVEKSYLSLLVECNLLHVCCMILKNHPIFKENLFEKCDSIKKLFKSAA